MWILYNTIYKHNLNLDLARMDCSDDKLDTCSTNLSQLSTSVKKQENMDLEKCGKLIAISRNNNLSFSIAISGPYLLDSRSSSDA